MDNTLSKASQFLVDQIILRNRIHLLGGISSSGKTRFAVPALNDWSMGIPFLGEESYPVPWGIVACDRPLRDVHDSLESMGLPKDCVPIVPAFGKHSIPKFKIMESIRDRGLHLVFWEGFDMMVRRPNDPYEVKEFLSEVSGYCDDYDLTVLGSVGVPKMKPNETYENPRQLIGGSTIWERATSTNLIIAPETPDIDNPGRLIYVCLKNAPSFVMGGKFLEHGILTFKQSRFGMFAKPARR